MTDPILDYHAPRATRPRRPSRLDRWVAMSFACFALEVIALVSSYIAARATRGLEGIGVAFMYLANWIYGGPALFSISTLLGIRTVWRGNRWGWAGVCLNCAGLLATFVVIAVIASL